MSGPGRSNRLSRQQVVLRAAVLLLPLLGLAAEHQGGAAVQPGYLVVVSVLAAATALAPDSHTGLVVVLLVGGHWLSSADQSLGPWVLLLAFALLGFHVAALLAGEGPPSLVLEAEMIWLWLRRFAVCAAATVLVWLAARVATGLQLPESALVWVAGLLAVGVWTVVLSRLLTRPAG